jgi:hypothetical protein
MGHSRHGIQMDWARLARHRRRLQTLALFLRLLLLALVVALMYGSVFLHYDQTRAVLFLAGMVIFGILTPPIVRLTHKDKWQ